MHKIDKLIALLDKEELSSEERQQLIDAIGEPLVRNKLKQMFSDKFMDLFM
ncbi:hypothetical protein [Fusibacter ferrireducens]|uniref:Uncharacterized protein n=1 Tax=Fusibacter ferrireducens TaxID=2785058 RepID=A0ABR9ZSA4_9FIRM|nr:hypothetical protein [Fusibacter ferrireducens]MBF4693340.1 hypothetical protein [Fusibacter ferrireducens]